MGAERVRQLLGGSRSLGQQVGNAQLRRGEKAGGLTVGVDELEKRRAGVDQLLACEKVSITLPCPMRCC